MISLAIAQSQRQPASTITVPAQLSTLAEGPLADLALRGAPGDGAAATQDRALHDYSAEPERLYLAGEQHELVRRAILALPPHYRAVIELRHFQDCSYDEIALALALPLSDVKSHLFRARRLLRDWLEEHA
jgi:RNA polymerase sigma factor (sigma-70 family)